MYYILSPIPLEELEKYTPKTHPELIDKYGNVDTEGFYCTPEGQKFYNEIMPLVIKNRPKKVDLMDSMFWDLLFIDLIYNKDYYVYILSQKNFENFYGSANVVSTGNLHYYQEKLEKWLLGKDTNPKPVRHWFGYNSSCSDEDELSDTINNFFDTIQWNKAGIWSMKIKGVGDNNG